KELNIALVHHADEGNEKGVQHCLWAGADPHAPAPSLRFPDDSDEDDGEIDPKDRFMVRARRAPSIVRGQSRQAPALKVREPTRCYPPGSPRGRGRPRAPARVRSCTRAPCRAPTAGAPAAARPTCGSPRRPAPRAPAARRGGRPALPPPSPAPRPPPRRARRSARGSPRSVDTTAQLPRTAGGRGPSNARA